MAAMRNEHWTWGASRGMVALSPRCGATATSFPCAYDGDRTSGDTYPMGIAMTVLPSLLSQDAAVARIAELEAKLAAMRQAATRKITFKVSDKGALSVYGLGRFPVTLYRRQMERLLAEATHITAFIEANSELLATKD